MLGLTVGDAVPDRLGVVEVFALAVFEFAYLALAVKLFHLVGSGHVAVVFAESVDEPRFFNRLYKLDSFFHILAGNNLGEDVLSCLKATDGEGRVLVCVVCENYRIHIVLYKFIKACVVGNIVAADLLLLFKSGNVFVADGNELCVVRNLAVVYHTRAAICTEHAYLNFSSFLS